MILFLQIPCYAYSNIQYKKLETKYQNIIENINLNRVNNTHIISHNFIYNYYLNKKNLFYPNYSKNCNDLTDYMLSNNVVYLFTSNPLDNNYIYLDEFDKNLCTNKSYKLEENFKSDNLIILELINLEETS